MRGSHLAEAVAQKFTVLMQKIHVLKSILQNIEITLCSKHIQSIYRDNRVLKASKICGLSARE